MKMDISTNSTSTLQSKHKNYGTYPMPIWVIGC